MGFANFCEFYAEFTPVTIAVRLIFATVLGGVIGLERATRHHTAGIRTFALVCLGSAISSVVNIYMVNISGNASGDISRIPAQVVSGIGFLGVGTIIITGKNQVKGLTTASNTLGDSNAWYCARRRYVECRYYFFYTYYHYCTWNSTT